MVRSHSVHSVHSVLGLAAVVPLLVACGDEPSQAGDPPTVEVVDSGEGDKRVFEIDVEEGHRETTVISLDQTIDTGAGTSDAPQVSFTLESEVTGVEDDRIEITQTYSSVDVAGDDATSAQVEETLRPLVGLEGTAVLSRTGALLESELEAPDDLDPAIAQVFDQLEDQAGSLGVSFPEEEIGEGAEWTAVGNLELSGVEVEQTTTYRLDQLDGDAYLISTRLEQDYEPGDADGFELVEGTGSGTGGFDGTVGLLFATSGRADAQNSLRVSSGGQEQTVSTTVTTTIVTSVD